MTIVEGMKQIKILLRKHADLCDKIKAHCADLSYETPVYGTETDQRQKVQGWLQSCGDIVQEVSDLKRRISRTNLETMVSIQLDGRAVSKCITEWVARRISLAALDEGAWRALTDRGLKEGQLQATQPGQTPQKVTIRRYYEPAVRDAKVELYRSEPMLIDQAMEGINATTELKS